MDEEGVRVVLSPAQMASVLVGQPITPDATFTNRLWGGAKAIQGGLELLGASALIAAPEPTMLTKVGGIVLAVHGSDTAATGLRQMWSGQEEKSLTEQGVTEAAKALGADPDTAGTIGAAVDIAVPIAVAGAVGAGRALATRAGRISLLEQETLGGHTIARHIGRSEAQLRARLVAQPGIPAASSFRTLQAAEAVLADALKLNRSAIQTWASSPTSPNRLRLFFEAKDAIGYGVVRASNALQDMKKVLIVLEKTNVGGKIYYILTSYPVP